MSLSLYETLLSKKAWGRKELASININVVQSNISTSDLLQQLIGRKIKKIGLQNLYNFYFSLLDYINNTLTPSFTSEYALANLKQFWISEKDLGLYDTSEIEQRYINMFVNTLKKNIPDTVYYGRRLFISDINKAMFTIFTTTK